MQVGSEHDNRALWRSGVSSPSPGGGRRASALPQLQQSPRVVAGVRLVPTKSRAGPRSRTTEATQHRKEGRG